ncbi:Gfo/Idh/MocA family oxidoreductase [Flavihumibacter sp. R14]|nr:Gfo/Idh/MocA family oxidoreductase [Flavihumibacter soli]
METRNPSRRRFIRNLSAGLGTLMVSPALTFGCLEKPQSKKLGVALVGLGSYSGGQLAPALQETKNCYLAGIVSGTPSKIKDWQQRYDIPAANCYNYENFDEIAKNPAIDIIYVVLPPSMHKEYTIRAAKAGKHVICEKPMAMNAAECAEMVAACKDAGRMLSIGYRLHFEPHNMEMMHLGQQKIYGKVLRIDTVNGYSWGGDPNAWRLKKAMGGGPLMDMGVYSIQGSRYTIGEEPTFVTAKEVKTGNPLFKEVEETISWELEFPGGTKAKGETSFSKNYSYLRAEAEKGSFEIKPAYGYGGQNGKTPKGPMNLPQVNEQALQMDDFAECVMQKKPTRVPGEMGMLDMKVIDAIFRSVRSGKREAIQ